MTTPLRLLPEIAMQPWFRTVTAMSLFFAIALHTSAKEPDRAALEFFEKNVRPLLAKRCYRCHSGKAEKLEAGLLLDSRSGWEKGGDSGTAVVPFKPDESLLIDAVRYDGNASPMPPDSKLPDAEIAALVKWVKLGAPDPRTGTTATSASKTINFKQAREFWSFRPLQPVVPPTVKKEAFCRTPIDHFVLKKQSVAGLTAADEASKRVFIRRATFDLIGLPPTPDEVDAFLADRRSDAYVRLVDRLLANPRYGERWGRHWLDLARFAESHGFEHDYDRPSAYHYRDFVIEALNADLPYDLFVKWQLAGDEYEPNNNLALKATGFLAAGVHSTQITKNEVEKHRYDELDDMLHTTGTAMLGLTVGCARCHDHKYDPIPARDYYRLLSTFTTTVRTEIDLNLDPKGYLDAKAAFDREHAPLAAALEKYQTEQLPSRLASWELDRAADGESPDWIILDLVKQQSAGGATFKKLEDGSLLVNGKNANNDTYTFEAVVESGPITAIRLEALAHPSLAKKGPGRADNGNFALSSFRVTAAPVTGGESKTVKLVNPIASFEQKGLHVKAAIDDNKKSGWAVDPQFGKNHAAVFETETDIESDEPVKLTFRLDFQTNKGHNIGRPRLAVSTSRRPIAIHGDAMPQDVLAILAVDPAKRSAEQQQRLLTWYGPRDPKWSRLHGIVREHLAHEPKPNLVKALISSEGLAPVRLHSQGEDFFERTFFLSRGDPNQKQGVATQSFLQVLMTTSAAEKHWQQPPPEDWRTSYRRRALAEWITDVEYGAGALLARVIVNRLWQHHLGRGIVATPSDFGRQGDAPTHPQLLDWLAGELIRHDWSLKAMHRLIMTSAVYRQSSRFDAADAKLDPENTLLWRRSPTRLEAEVIRDAVLAVGNQIDLSMYGPGTLDANSRRRSIYFTVKRSSLVPMMQIFDAPEALTGIGQRPTTTIAPQALYLMNNENVRNAANGFAGRVDAGSKASIEKAIRRAYRVALSREPTDAEFADAIAFIKKQTKSYHDSGKPDAGRLALTDFCQVLLGLNEFIYVE